MTANCCLLAPMERSERKCRSCCFVAAGEDVERHPKCEELLPSRTEGEEWEEVPKLLPRRSGGDGKRHPKCGEPLPCRREGDVENGAKGAKPGCDNLIGAKNSISSIRLEGRRGGGAP